MTKTAEPKERYTGTYNRLFPMKVSTNTFLTIYILHLLNTKGKLYGKEIINKIEDRFEGKWKPSHGLVYPILRELEKEDLVEGSWLGDGSKKTIRVYNLTDKGREIYTEEKQHHKDMFEDSFTMMETLMIDLYDEYKMMDFR